MDEKHPKTTTGKRTPPARRRRQGKRKDLARGKGSAPEPRLPRPPAPVTLARAPVAPIVGWPHLLVNGSDATFRRMLRGLAALIHRLEEVYALAGGGVGLSGTELEFLLALAEADRDGDGASQSGLAHHLGISVEYASGLAATLARNGLLEKRPDPAHRSRRLLVLTAKGWEAAAEATPLIEAAHNLAFQPIRPKDYDRFRRLAAALDTSSSIAVEILARRMGENLDTSVAELRQTMRRLGGK
jgi:DNA-binding MarR family transcriptional regulator